MIALHVSLIYGWSLLVKAFWSLELKLWRRVCGYHYLVYYCVLRRIVLESCSIYLHCAWGKCFESKVGLNRNAYVVMPFEVVFRAYTRSIARVVVFISSSDVNKPKKTSLSFERSLRERLGMK